MDSRMTVRIQGINRTVQIVPASKLGTAGVFIDQDGKISVSDVISLGDMRRLLSLIPSLPLGYQPFPKSRGVKHKVD